MKKRTVFAIISALVLIIIGSAICFVSLMISGFDTTRLDTSGKRTLNSKTVNEDFSAVEIEASYANIRLLTTDNECKIEMYDREKEDYSVKVEHGILKIAHISQKKWYDFVNISFSGPEYDIIVYIPEKEYERITVNGSSADLLLSGISSQKTELKTASGDISVAKSEFKEALDIKTSSGDIEVLDVNSKKTVIETVSGECELDNQTGDELGISSVSGDVSVERVEINGEITVKTTSGNCGLDAIKFEEIDIKTTSGDVEAEIFDKCFFDVKTTSGEVDVPFSDSNGLPFKVETVSGDIEIEYS